MIVAERVVVSCSPLIFCSDIRLVRKLFEVCHNGRFMAFQKLRKGTVIWIGNHHSALKEIYKNTLVRIYKDIRYFSIYFSFRKRLFRTATENYSRKDCQLLFRSMGFHKCRTKDNIFIYI